MCMHAVNAIQGESMDAFALCVPRDAPSWGLLLHVLVFTFFILFKQESAKRVIKRVLARLTPYYFSSSWLQYLIFSRLGSAIWNAPCLQFKKSGTNMSRKLRLSKMTCYYENDGAEIPPLTLGEKNHPIQSLLMSQLLMSSLSSPCRCMSTTSAS